MFPFPQIRLIKHKNGVPKKVLDVPLKISQLICNKETNQFFYQTYLVSSTVTIAYDIKTGLKLISEPLKLNNPGKKE